MKEQLDKLVGKRVYVVKPIGGTTSLSFSGDLHGGLAGHYHLPGNPAFIFSVLDVDRIQSGPDTATTIRLTS